MHIIIVVVCCLLSLAPVSWATPDANIKGHRGRRDTHHIHEHGHNGQEGAASQAATGQSIFRVKRSNPEDLRTLTERYGVQNVREIPEFPEYYVVNSEDYVQQPQMADTLASRIKRTPGLDRFTNGELEYIGPVTSNLRVKRRPEDAVGNLRGGGEFSPDHSVANTDNALKDDEDYHQKMEKRNPLLEVMRVGYTWVKSVYKRVTEKYKRDASCSDGIKSVFTDKLWMEQWYMHGFSHTDCDAKWLNLNLLKVYELGYSGMGITVTVLDDGLETDHEDLKTNYASEASYDLNSGPLGDPDPSPEGGDLSSNAHGTKCAGEIAMEANNGLCGVGVAFNARVGGIRLLGSRNTTDILEGRALKYALDKIDIYSASWGPSDDGKTVEGPGRMAQQAIIDGVTKGRNGKGALYVWASGNGGMNFDNCNCDGYVSSIFTISIGSATQHAKFPWYAEQCPSTLAVAPSSGDHGEKKIVTTTVNNNCINTHTGTSAAAPLAVGVLALVLEANANLTWRDVQHLIVYTSNHERLSENAGWNQNGVGIYFSHFYGFGVLDAEKLVTTAETFTRSVGQHLLSVFNATDSPSGNVSIQNNPVVISFNADDDGIQYLEHVEILVNIGYHKRGCLEFILTSPLNTKSQLLRPRTLDRSEKGFINWKFMSVHFWGENPEGQWDLEVKDMSCEGSNNFMLEIGHMELFLYGTEEAPQIMNLKAMQAEDSDNEDDFSDEDGEEDDEDENGDEDEDENGKTDEDVDKDEYDKEAETEEADTNP